MVSIFKRNKRGVELSVNVIIIAAITLIVLIVLIAIFTGRIGKFSSGVEQQTAGAEQRLCAAQGLVTQCSQQQPAIVTAGCPPGQSKVYSLQAEATGQGWIDCKYNCFVLSECQG